MPSLPPGYNSFQNFMDDLKEFHDHAWAPFIQLCEPVISKLFNGKYSSLRDATREDIWSEAQIIALNNLDNFRGHNLRLLLGWVRGICDNKCKEELRKRGRDREVTKEYENEKKAEIPSPSSRSRGDERGRNRKIMFADLEECQNNLNDKRRKVFESIHTEGLSQQETSTKLNISINAVRQRIHHAYNAIKRCMERKGHQF